MRGWVPGSTPLGERMTGPATRGDPSAASARDLHLGGVRGLRRFAKGPAALPWCGMIQPPDPPARVAVLRALNGLGDMLCAVPALRALRAAWPHAHVTLVGLPSQAPLAARFPAYIDDLLEFPGFPGIPERPAPVEPLEAFAERARARGFDLALQMQGDGTVINRFLPLLGARRMAGFAIPGAPRPEGAELFPYPGGHEIHRWLTLTSRMGLPSQGDGLEFPALPADRAAWKGLAAEHGLEAGRYACLHAGAADERRRWPASSFAALGDALASRGLRIVLTGTAGERAVTAAVAAAMASPPLDLAGRTPLGVTASLLASARLLVTNDTGLSHLAAATRTPSVVIFLAADPGRWAPLDRARHRAVLSSSLADRALEGMAVAAEPVPSIDAVSHVTFQLLQPKPSEES